MTLESGDNQALFGGKLLGNDMAVVVLGGGSVGGDIVLHLGILEENNEQAVTAVELLQVRKLAKHGRHALRQHAEREIPLHSDKGLSALRFGGDLVATTVHLASPTLSNHLYHNSKKLPTEHHLFQRQKIS